MAQLPSIRICVILETIGQSLVCITCLSVLDAVTQMTRLAQLDRGVPLTIVRSSLRRSIEIQKICVQQGRETWRIYERIDV